MTLRSYIWSLRLSTLVLLASWLAITMNIDPQKSGTPGVALFYLSLFLFLSGLFLQIITFIRRKIEGDETVLVQVGINFRESLLLATMVIIFLLMQSFHVLVWWDALLVIAGIFLVELFFLSRE